MADFGCLVEGCDRSFYAQDRCRRHYKTWRRTQPGGCSVADCQSGVESRGLCAKHAQRLRRGQDLEMPDRFPGFSMSNGYRLVRRAGHPNADSKGRIFEHRLVMADALGRPLLPGENVHHINGDKLDNRPENLELWVTSQPAGQRVADLLLWAQSILDLYGDQPRLDPD